MKLYAIRDRLIDYFMTPFAAPGDKDVMSSLAQTINNGGDNVPIAQAPHHYEIWVLAEIDDEGNVREAKKFLCDAASLVRTSLRTHDNEGPGGGKAPNAAERSENAPEGRPAGGGPYGRVIPNPADAAPSKA